MVIFHSYVSLPEGILKAIWNLSVDVIHVIRWIKPYDPVR